jgi:hypothetical protein
MNPSTKKTIILLTSKGWGMRTFLQTDVLPYLQPRVRVVLLSSSTLVNTLKQTLGAAADIVPLKLFEHTQGAYGRTYKRRNHYFLHLSRTSTRLAKLHRYRQTLKGRWHDLIRFFLLSIEAELLTNPTSLSLLVKREQYLFHKEFAHLVRYYEDVFQSYQPDLVVSTVPHVPEEAPPVLVARHLGIKVACWINSWDNLYSKAAYFTQYDHYFVWSERMRQELLRYYPETHGKSITVTGVPHFDWYHMPEMLLPREKFCQQLQLDSKRPIILYATATPYLAPAEDLIVKRLATDLEKPEFSVRPQMILRLHPGEAGGRFKDHQFGRSVRVQIPNKRGNGKLDKFYPTTKENQEFVNTIAHADVVINLASTITLDAAICDRPVINIAYDLSPNLRYQARLNQYYTEYDHYQTVLQCGAVRLARSHEELLSHIKTYLLHPEFEREGRKKLVGLWCGPNDGRAGKRLATSILQLIAAQRDIAPHLAHSDL